MRESISLTSHFDLIANVQSTSNAAGMAAWIATSRDEHHRIHKRGPNMAKMRTGYSSYLSTTLDYKQSKPLSPEELDRLVTLHRGGDDSAVRPLIFGHMRMVAGIVGSIVKSSRKKEDALAAALLALVEAVIDARECLYDNNITAYITTTVKFKVKEHLANDHVVRMPSRTVRYKIANGEVFEDIVPGDGGEIRADAERWDNGNGSDQDVKGRTPGNVLLPFVIPIAPPPDVRETLEFRELVMRAAQGPLNEVILKMRLEGFGYVEIGQKVGLSKTRVGQIAPQLQDRLTALVK